ncbi:MAG: hypothetical protein IT382_11170 [Deltaproteobacteria bacterium]|nr:hypothetical protein [Deltaproteobacteria bacterium]
MIDDDLPGDLRALLDAERRRDEPAPQRKARVHQALAASLGGGFLPDGGGLDGGGLDAGASLGAGAAAASGSGAAGLGMKAGGAVAAKVAAATVAKAGSVAAGVATASAAGAGAAAGGAVAGGAAAGGAVAGGAVAGTALGKGLALTLALTMAGTTATGIYLAQSDEPAAASELRVDTEVPPDFDPSVLGGRPAPTQKPKAPVARPSAALQGGAAIDPAALAPEPAVVPSIEPSAEQRAERLAAERGLLDEARGAVSRGNGGAALIALEAHRQSFPDGQLVEEREALTVMALAKAGRMDEAQKKAERFRTRYPQSLFSAAVAQAIGQ